MAACTLPGEIRELVLDDQILRNEKCWPYSIADRLAGQIHRYSAAKLSSTLRVEGIFALEWRDVVHWSGDNLDGFQQLEQGPDFHEPVTSASVVLYMCLGMTKDRQHYLKSTVATVRMC